MIEPVLNELSLEPAPVPTIERVTSLLNVIKKLDGLGFPRLIRQTREALLRDIEDGLSFRAWLFQRAPRDLRQFLAGRLEKSPYVEKLHQNQEEARRSLLQAFCGDDEANLVDHEKVLGDIDHGLIDPRVSDPVDFGPVEVDLAVVFDLNGGVVIEEIF